MTNKTRVMRLQVLAIVSGLVLALLGSSIAIIITEQPTAFAQHQLPQSFTAKLAGNNEVPPVNTQATGMVQFQSSPDKKEINYDLTATNLNGFMMANIHQGKTGEIRKPVIAQLSMGKGKITSSDLQGPLAGKQISDLVDIMKNGGAYVNVHTQQFQNGEIRGQIMSGSSPLKASAQNAIPFLPTYNNNTVTPQPQQQLSSPAMHDSGTLTVKQVILGTDKLLPNSQFKITPNPFTLKGSLIIQDNNETIDSNLTNGIISLKNVKFSSYLLNETSSAGFGPVLLKTRITVHNTNPNPIVTIENRQLNVPFKGIATVTAPFLNDSSLRTFVANGATLGGTVPIKKVDQLPPGFLVSTEKRPVAVVVSNTTTNTITFKTQIPSTASASQIYNSFKIPTYPAPVKDIASQIIYISPVFVIKQQDSDNNTFTLTPIIAKIFPDMSLLLNHSSQVASGLAKVQDIKMKFARNASDVGFSFGISDSIPAAFRLPKVPVDTLALFMNIGYLGKGGGGTTAVKVVNFSNSKSFASSSDINIIVSKSLGVTKLADGCPDINLYSFNESVAKWAQLDKPMRTRILDLNDECGYTLHTQHLSKFAVGGVKQQAS